VPVQDDPLEAAAVLFDGQAGQVAQGHFAQALAAMSGLYVQVFQVQATFVQKARVVVKPHDVGDGQAGLVAGGGDQAVGGGVFTEKAVAQCCFGGLENIGELLEFGHFPHQAQYVGNVVGSGGS